MALIPPVSTCLHQRDWVLLSALMLASSAFLSSSNRDARFTPVASCTDTSSTQVALIETVEPSFKDTSIFGCRTLIVVQDPRSSAASSLVPHFYTLFVSRLSPLLPHLPAHAYSSVELEFRHTVWVFLNGALGYKRKNRFI